MAKFMGVKLVTGVLGRFRGKALRFMAVSLLGTVVSQVLIWVINERLERGGVTTNLIAVCVTAGPSFVLNKRWVWARTGAHSWTGEVVPFWAMSLAGLALSTVFVWIADRFTDATWAVSAANLAGFGALWVAKFVVLDKYLFSDDESRGT